MAAVEWHRTLYAMVARSTIPCGEPGPKSVFVDPVADACFSDR
jgi:hypothetical protein